MGLLPFVKDRVTFVFYDENDIVVDALEVDATISANHRRHAQITRHPVAKGKAITDNVRPDPDGLTLECFWGNRPGDIIEMGKRYAKGDFQHAEAAYVKLNTAFTKAYKATINMRIWTYENMVIEDITVPETVDDGSSVSASVTFTQIETVSAQTVPQAKPLKTGDGAKNVTGGQPKAPPNPPQAQSAAARGADSMGWTQNMTLLKPPR